MEIKTIVWLGVIWLAVNALFPLVLNSLERQHERKIDKAVGAVIYLLRRLGIRLFQVVFTVFFLPLMLALLAIKNVAPRLWTSRRTLREMDLIRLMAFEREFPASFLAAFKNRKRKSAYDTSGPARNQRRGAPKRPL